MVSGQESIKSSTPVKAIPYPYTILENPKEFKVLSDNVIIMTAGQETDLNNPAKGSYLRTTAPKILIKPDGNFFMTAQEKTSFENK